jgi:dTDP-4-amino-4,6-dideoxygalactose transaminase
VELDILPILRESTLMKRIPFSRPTATGKEKENLVEVLERGNLPDDGPFSQACTLFWRTVLESRRLGVEKALVTPSGTDALELAAMLCDLEPG